MEAPHHTWSSALKYFRAIDSNTFKHTGRTKEIDHIFVGVNWTFTSSNSCFHGGHFFVSKKSPKFRCAFNCHFEPSHSRTFTKRGSFDIIPSFPNFCTFTNINRPRGHTSSITKETIMEMIVYLVDDPWTFCSNYRDTRRIIYSHKLNISNNDGNTYGIYIYNYIYIYIDNILWVLNINNDSL